MNETLGNLETPKKFVAFGHAFRCEAGEPGPVGMAVRGAGPALGGSSSPCGVRFFLAGASGTATRGLYRVHQFSKVACRLFAAQAKETARRGRKDGVGKPMADALTVMFTRWSFSLLQNQTWRAAMRFWTRLSRTRWSCSETWAFISRHAAHPARGLVLGLGGWRDRGLKPADGRLRPRFWRCQQTISATQAGGRSRLRASPARGLRAHGGSCWTVVAQRIAKWTLRPGCRAATASARSAPAALRNLAWPSFPPPPRTRAGLTPPVTLRRSPAPATAPTFRAGV